MTAARRVIVFALSLFLLSAASSGAFAEESGISIFYTTDTHGHVVSDADTIGLDMVAGIVKASPNAVLVDAGDYLMGAPLAAMSRGKDVVALMKQAGYFAAAVGNHEFDYGPDVLMLRKTEAEAEPGAIRLIAANIREKDGEPLFQPETDTTIDGVRICFFGLTTQGTKYMVTPRYIEGISFDDVEDTARRLAAKQRAEGCGIVVALSHVGSRKERFATSRELARVPGIDVVIDGHSHVVVDEKAENGAMLVSSGAHGKHLGRLDIRYDKAEGKITKISNTLLSPADTTAYEPDKELTQTINAMVARQDKALAQVVGNAAADFPGDKKLMRTSETALGDMLADAARKAYSADIALLNAGGLREGLTKGPVNLKDIISIIPYRDQAVMVRVTGKELASLLEFGFSKLPEPSGAFPQVSGISVRVAPHNAPGSRVLSVCLENGDEIDPDREYLLVTSDYVAKGGDGYPILAGKNLLEAGKSLQQAAIDFFGSDDGSAYADGPAGRIVFVNQ